MHAAYSLAYKTGANFLGYFGGKNPRLIAEEIRYMMGIYLSKITANMYIRLVLEGETL